MLTAIGKWKVLLALALALLVVPMVSALRAQEKIKIGFAIEAMKGERWQTDLDAFETRAKQLGAEVVSADANGDDARQLQQVKDMIQGGIQVLVLLPHDAMKAAAIVDAAKAANVKVISYDRLARNSDVDLYITFNRREIGRMQAEALVKRAPKGNYVLIAGSANDPGAKTLHDAQMSVLQPYVARGEIKIVADDYIKDWVPTDAYVAMLKALDATQGNVAAVVASNDGLAGGAIQALREKKLAGKVAVSGQDADLAAVIDVAQGTQTMTVYKPIKLQASRAAEEAVQLAKGEKPQGDMAVNNGKVEVPVILLKPVLVTRENIGSTVVKDGFQSLKSINEALTAEQQIKPVE
ncbi:MAG TPA: substrate-binding domain-containing protein [Candidatus Eisenbacteria bacterium]|nr:substrate-binding domain-containing protein [Candidatus Eisenbacteria bacterium]